MLVSIPHANMSESINHVIKQEVDWKESKLPVLIDHLKTVVDQHVNELQKAVIARGEWKFISPYKHLQIPQAIWFSKNSRGKKCSSSERWQFHSQCTISKLWTDKHCRKYTVKYLEQGYNVGEVQRRFECPMAM